VAVFPLWRTLGCGTIACWAVLAIGCASAVPRNSGIPAGGLLVGVAAIDITPEQSIRLTGYGNRVAPSERVEQRLWAKAIAFGDDARRPAVLIATDLIGVPRDMTEEVVRRLQSARIDRAHFAIAATHTHTGPSLTGVLPKIFSSPVTPDQRTVVDRYSTDLVNKLEQVARAALADRRPARVAWTIGRAAFASNRRVLKDGKWTAFGVQPDGPVDHDMPILTVRSSDNALRAVLVSYACHATTLEGSQNFVHGDWPGAAKELIGQRHPGAVALVTIGTGADANPNPRGGGLPDVARHARAIADEVDRLLTTTMTEVTAPPVGNFRYINLSFARAPDTVPYPVQTWTFGSRLAMVFLGGEVVADYGLRLKRELGSDTARLWVNAYSNDVAFYVASRRMIPEGGYEVDRSMDYYGQPSPLAEGTEEQIVAAVREMLRR